MVSVFMNESKLPVKRALAFMTENDIYYMFCFRNSDAILTSDATYAAYSFCA